MYNKKQITILSEKLFSTYFAVYTSQYDETFIAQGNTPEEAFKELRGQWYPSILEETKFYQATQINPIIKAKFK